MPCWKMQCIHCMKRWKGTARSSGCSALTSASGGRSERTPRREASSSAVSVRTPQLLKSSTRPPRMSGLPGLPRSSRKLVADFKKFWCNSHRSSTSKGPNPASLHTWSSRVNSSRRLLLSFSRTAALMIRAKSVSESDPTSTREVRVSRALSARVARTMPASHLCCSTESTRSSSKPTSCAVLKSTRTGTREEALAWREKTVLMCA
mmetsp:Transcript_19055/g.47760  ORF Transcript_19055/g.47760 Transcript_19055/m.47760 type:complete len:206 (+) Transcript_19055:397-1014(+)